MPLVKTPLSATGNLQGKVKGSFVENPNAVYYSNSTSALMTATQGTEIVQAAYAGVVAPSDGQTNSETTSVNGTTAQRRHAFDIVATVERNYGTSIPGANLAEKVAWLKANLSRVVCDWYGYGNSPLFATSPAATFTRSSVATLPDGTQVSSGAPRFVSGKYGAGVMVEEGTTNFLPYPLTQEYYGGALRSSGVYYTTNTSTFRITVSGQPTGGPLPGCKVAVTSGSTITVSGKTDLASVQIYTKGFDSSDAQVIAQTSVSVVPDASGYFVKSIVMTGTNLSYVNVGVGNTGVTSFYLDKVNVEVKAYPTSFVNGTRSLEQLTVPSAGLVSNAPWTIECWAKINYVGGSTFATIFSSWSKFYLAVTSGGKVVLSWKDGTQQTTRVDMANITDWHHWAITFNGATAIVYLDGLAIITQATQFPDSNTVIRLGNIDSADPLNGTISDFRISNVVRTPAQILASYNSATASAVDANTTLKMPLNGTLNTTSGATVNKASLTRWNANGNLWDTVNGTNLTGSVAKVSTAGSSNYGQYIDANGLFHVLVYADASNGTAASTVVTDYVEVTAELNFDISTKTDWDGNNYLNYVDANRIENNIAVLSSYLALFQYAVPTPSLVTNRDVKSIDTISSVNRIEQNLDNIRANFITPDGYLPMEVWTVGKPFDFNVLNRWEANTQLLYDYGALVYSSFKWCGQTTCGGGGLY